MTEDYAKGFADAIEAAAAFLGKRAKQFKAWQLKALLEGEADNIRAIKPEAS